MDARGVVVVTDDVADCESRVVGTAALEHVANRPIADHVLDELVSAGVRDVVITSSTDQARKIRDALEPREQSHGLRLHFVEDDGPLNVATALRLAAPIVGAAPCIIHLASGLLGEPLTPLAAQLQNCSPDVILIVHQHPGPEEHLSSATQKVLHIAELHPERAALGMTGVWLFGPGAVRHVADTSRRSGAEPDVTQMAERISAAGGKFQIRIADGWRNYRGNPLHLLELNQIALDRLDVDYRHSNGNVGGHWDGKGNRIEGRVWIDETASVHASVIVGPAVVGAGAHIVDAYIGPYTSIGANARIEGAEIERSIIAAGASIAHIGGRLAASVIGRDARVFRDFSLPRALRLRLGDGAEVAVC